MATPTKEITFKKDSDEWGVLFYPKNSGSYKATIFSKSESVVTPYY